MDSDVRARLKNRLMIEREHLLGDIVVSLQPPNSDESTMDDGSETLEHEWNVALDENQRHELTLVERALRRMEEGTYGLCAECGQVIAGPRLEALPSATLCISCKAREERR